MATTLPISLYIPCYNGARFLDRILPHVKAQTYPLVEIFMVDDGSTDDSVPIARRYGVNVIEHGTNRGLAATRNTAVRSACAEFVASVDADVRPRKDWLERLAAALQEGRFVAAGGDLRETVHETLADRWRHVHMHQSWGSDRVEDPKVLFGSNTLFLKSALVQVGLYDEACRTNGEDVDLSKRLRESGHHFVYEPTAICEHLRQDSLRSVSRTYWRYHNHRDVKPTLRSTLRAQRRARKILLNKVFLQDVLHGRAALAGVDLWMYADWLRHEWRRYLSERSRRRRPEGEHTSPPSS